MAASTTPSCHPKAASSLNLEQKPDKDISANLEEQHMDGIEQLVGGEEVAGLQDDVGVSAGDGGVDEFAEIRESMLRILLPLYFTIPHK